MLRAYGLDLEIVESKFSALENDIKLIFFKRETHCPHCTSTQRLLEQIASITYKIEFEVYNFAINQEKDHACRPRP